MPDDPFAFHVERLTVRHRHRHTAATVAAVTLQQWLSLRRRYSNPFDIELFDHIDDALSRMPASGDAPNPALVQPKRMRAGAAG